MSHSKYDVSKLLNGKNFEMSAQAGTSQLLMTSYISTALQSFR
jgi:hypothetical protein